MKRKKQQSSMRIPEFLFNFSVDMDYDKRKVPESPLYQCKKCKSRRVSKIDKQTRAGDEPMTSYSYMILFLKPRFFSCAECGTQWRN